MTRYVLLLRDIKENKSWLWRSKGLGALHDSFRTHIRRRRGFIFWTPSMDAYVLEHYYQIPAATISDRLRYLTNKPVTKNAVISRYRKLTHVEPKKSPEPSRRAEPNLYGQRPSR